MKVAWVLGWAVPLPWFARYAEATFPGAEHYFAEPGPDVWERLEGAGACDALGGYSLGAQLLLENQARAARVAPRVGLLAPIFAFAQEAGLGGKIARAQIKFLARWLRRERAAALADFYLRAGLDVPADWSGALPGATLEWGLSRLENGAGQPPAPRDWKLFCGTDDALLDGAQLAALDPALQLVAGATHHPEKLMHAWAREFF